ncbi:flagellin [Bacteriovorax sp. Seq25_V]|uniref:flagellin N-terminal helical domain-containing protein n=1 Tax=Bacteriovorax sp. Seq25_V TaxID=1201288 RepID=UPI00038A14F5|nr:flagellin [Bacteriovorax sp. Seq25_V]EQC43594.1 putative flagellin protein [Bacteriovorax sp. Seq25_V]
MGMRINTNVQSLAAQRSLGNVKRAQNTSLEKLASGNRINKAGDDAAGLAISEKLKANIRGTQQATRNAGDGISMVQTAEGGLNEVSNILIRLRELSVQSASDTVGDTERKFTDLEFQNLVQEVDRISESTKFNGKNLLNGTGDQMDFQIGINNTEGLDRIAYDPSQSSAKAADIGIEGLTVASKDGAQGNLDVLDTAIEKISGNRANLGALQNRLQSTISNLEVSTENLSAANSRIRDTDIASESAEMARTNILSNSATAVLAQANQSNQGALRLIG